jgi:hypothetical protein
VRTAEQESKRLHFARLLDLGFGKCEWATGYYRVGYQHDAVRALAARRGGEAFPCGAYRSAGPMYGLRCGWAANRSGDYLPLRKAWEAIATRLCWKTFSAG